MEKELFIGTSGWVYGHWFKKFYPENLPKKDWFQHFSQNFSTVEINNTFYRWPNTDLLKRWYNNAPQHFKYTLKSPRTITHVKQLNDVGKWVEDFYSLGDELKEKMGCYLYQLPPQFKFNEVNFERVKKFLTYMDQNRDNAIEFRHSDWWNKEVVDLLKEYKVAFCSVSGLKMPDTQIITGDFAYLRFHGEHYSTRYSIDEIKDFARQIEEMNCKRIYAYFNNDYKAFAIYNAHELIKELHKKEKIKEEVG